MRSLNTTVITLLGVPPPIPPSPSQTRYSYGHDLISQTMVGAGATSFYTSDGLGSVRALTNSAGSITDRYAYDAFGSALATTGSISNAYRFTGAQQDAALGMYYLRARYYQPGSGRFWTRDTWGLDQQHPREWNRYVYVAADPVNGVDPSGYGLAEGALTQHKVSVRTVTKATLLGLTVACIISRAAFELGTALWIAQHGGEREVVNPCATIPKPETCATKHPTLPLCSAIRERFYFDDLEQAVETGRILANDPLAEERKPKKIPFEACPGPEATHYEFRGSSPQRPYYTSIVSCKCCDDSSGRAKTHERCGYFGDHWQIFKDYRR